MSPKSWYGVPARGFLHKSKFLRNIDLQKNTNPANTMESEDTETENCIFCGEIKAVATGLYGCPVCHGEGLDQEEKWTG